MANYIAQWRSNHFCVKDTDAFEKEMSGIPGVYAEKEEDGRFVLSCSSDDDTGSMPQYRYGNKDEDEEEEIDFPAIIASHLLNGEVAILMEVGYEKLRYLVGEAIAVNSKGETRHVSLNDIYERAKELTARAEITMAEY